MNDLERSEAYTEISEHLDNIDEVIENLDTEGDEEFSEVVDLVLQIRKIIGSV